MCSFCTFLPRVADHGQNMYEKLNNKFICDPRICVPFSVQLLDVCIVTPFSVQANVTIAQKMTTSTHILFNSLFTDHSTIQCYIVLATDRVCK